MKQLSIMLKPASASCNMRCQYCFYADVADLREVHSFGVMTHDTTGTILANIRTDLSRGDSITFAFQGGEPTLAGLEYFHNFVSVTKEWAGIQVDYALQTNGLLLDEEWCRFLKEHHFLVGISWDILPECHDSARMDPAGRGTSRRVQHAITLLERHKVDYNVLCTLTNFVARHPQKVWKQITAFDIRYTQFTPCLDELGHTGVSCYALTPKRFAEFYKGLFPLWYADYQKGRYRSIKLFDDIVNLMAFGIPTACGIDGLCRPQLVVEADGSVYPCDFYCVDEYCLGSLTESTVRQIYETPAMTAFAHRPHQRPMLCAGCEFARLCGGYCKRMQRQVCCAPGDSFCGYRDFLQAHIRELSQIAQAQRYLQKSIQ